MKSLVYAAAAALALAAQTSPALASQSPAPSFKLIPLSPHVAVLSRAHCSADAAIDGTPYFEMPQIAREMGASGSTEVKIDLASTGNITAASVFTSSGNEWLDDAAVRGAKLARYIPETVNCQHVAGSYLLDIQF